MKISNVLRTFREAAMFQYLASLSQVDQLTVKICQSLLDSLTIQRWTTVQRLSRTLRQQTSDVKFADVKQVIQDLLRRQVLITQGSRIMFRTRLATIPDSASDQSDIQSVSSASVHSEKSSASSDHAASEKSSSGNQWVADQLGDNPRSDDSDAQSPLSSYFASVNSTLNEDYMKSESSNSQSSHGDHLVNRNDLSWLNSSSASSSIERSEESSKQDNQLDFATTPASNSVASSSSNSEVRQSSASQTAKSHQANQQAGQQFNSIAKSLFERVSFASLMSHPAKIQQIAEAEFNLVVASRKYEGIKQADGLFKYEFKMNYQKFGKIGNQINNMLMKDVSSHNN